VLTIVDNSSRVSPLIGVGFSHKGHDVVASLKAAFNCYGRLERIRVDNGPEFISKDLDLWAYIHQVELDFSRSGKPTDNSFIEAFNSRFRDECLNHHWFLSLEDAQTKIEARRLDYNLVRPHSSIGGLPPVEYYKMSLDEGNTLFVPIESGGASDEQIKAHSRRPEALAMRFG